MALFSIIPINITISFLKTCRKELKIEEIINLTKLCMSHNVFQFNGTFYEQTKRTAMVNSLFPLLAEIFLNKFETGNKKCIIINFINKKSRDL